MADQVASETRTGIGAGFPLSLAPQAPESEFAAFHTLQKLMGILAFSPLQAAQLGIIFRLIQLHGPSRALVSFAREFPVNSLPASLGLLESLSLLVPQLGPACA
jgi:hypothetical protein